MGYFSNGSEGSAFVSAHCDTCIHQIGCPVWSLHERHNYRQFGELESAKLHHEYLEALITGDTCQLYHPATPAELRELHQASPMTLNGANRPAPWIVEFAARKNIPLEKLLQ